MNVKELLIKYIFNLWFLSIFIFLLSVTPIGVPIGPGLDPSYVFAFNYFFAHSIQIGKDIMFSFGPLGFLLWPQPIGNNLIIAAVVVFSFKAVFILLLLNLQNLAKAKATPANLIVGAIATYICASIISVHDLLVFIPLLLILTFFLKQNIALPILASIFVAVALLVKSSAGIISLLFLISFMIYVIWKKNYKLAMALLLTTIISFLFIWFALYQNFIGIIDYFHATIELCRGNSSAMTINPHNNRIIFVTFIFALFSFPLLNREKVLLFLYAISLLSIAAYFKYAISREDHIFGFLNFLLVFLFVIFTATKKINTKVVLHLLLISMLFLSFIYVTPYKNGIIPHLKRNISALSVDSPNAFYFNDRFNLLQQQSISLLKPSILDRQSKELIGNNTVDVYPWDASYIAANSLNWKPRPAFQSYIAYTPFLDKHNSDFLKSNCAPEFIIWQLKNEVGEIRSIDNRYLLNDNPLTTYELFNRYTVVGRNASYIILKRIKSRLSSKFISEATYKWDQWINIPQNINNKESTFILAKADIQRSLLQKIKKLIYKELEVFVHYKLANGGQKKYRIVVDTAKNGIWVSPLLDRLFSFPLGKDVIAFKLTHNQYDFFKKSFVVQWNSVSSEEPLFAVERPNFARLKKINYTTDDLKINFCIDTYNDVSDIIDIRGWAFVENKTIDKSKKYIVLKNDEQSYVFSTENQERKDVTNFFKAKDLDGAGFKAIINKSDIPAGKYSLFILLHDEQKNYHMANLNKKVVVK